MIMPLFTISRLAGLMEDVRAGKMKLADGTTFEGEFRDDEPAGRGEEEMECVAERASLKLIY